MDRHIRSRRSIGARRRNSAAWRRRTIRAGRTGSRQSRFYHYRAQAPKYQMACGTLIAKLHENAPAHGQFRTLGILAETIEAAKVFRLRFAIGIKAIFGALQSDHKRQGLGRLPTDSFATRGRPLLSKQDVPARTSQRPTGDIVTAPVQAKYRPCGKRPQAAQCSTWNICRTSGCGLGRGWME